MIPLSQDLLALCPKLNTFYIPCSNCSTCQVSYFPFWQKKYHTFHNSQGYKTIGNGIVGYQLRLACSITIHNFILFCFPSGLQNLDLISCCYVSTARSSYFDHLFSELFECVCSVLVLYYLFFCTIFTSIAVYALLFLSY